MANVLILKSSILGQYSQSSMLIEHMHQKLQLQGSKVHLRDLAEMPIPVLDGDIAIGLRGTDSPTEKQAHAIALSNELIEEIKASDTLVIAAPMYNFAIPTQLKNWIDFIARAGVTFKYTEQGPIGLLDGKKAIIVTTRGGLHKDSGTDHITPYLKTVLGFVGINNVEFVYAEALNMGGDEAKLGMANAKHVLEDMIAA